MGAPADYWPQIITGITGVAGAVLGGSITAFAQSRAAMSARKYDRAALAAAFATEIKMTNHVIDVRGQIGTVEMLIETIDADIGTLTGALIRYLPDVKTPHEDLPIYEKHHGDIGKLGRLAVDVATFYSNLFMVRSTIIAFRTGELSDLPRSTLVSVIQSELDLWKSTKTLADDLVPKLFALTESVID